MSANAQMNQKYLLIGVAIAAVIIAMGYYYMRHGSSPASGAPTASSTTTAFPGGISVTGTGNATVEEVNSQSSVTAPSHSAPLQFFSSVSADVEAALNAQFAQAQAIFTKDPTNFRAWVELGILRKTGGDYAGAAEDWNYVSVIYPKNSVSFNDLADLYTNFITDYAKAEINYKQAIANDLGNLIAYEGLFSLYTDYGYKFGTSAASDILKEGIKNNPQAVDLYVLLARYYAGEGDSADAKVEYNAAIQLAQSKGNSTLVSQLQSEEAALP